jgi:hypothetical protein
MKTSVMGDPAWGGAISNLTSLFDPRTAAEGSALQARTRSFDADARFNDARAGLLGDRRKALDATALASAGYTPRQIAALQATQTDSMADLFAGVRTDTGTQSLLAGGDPRTAGILLNYAKAGDADFAPTDARADTLNRQIAQNALDLQRLKDSGALQIAQSRPVEVSPGATAIFAPGDVRNPNASAATPSQLFTAPALPGRIGADGSTTGTGRVGNISADESEILKKIQLEEAGGKALAAMGQYPMAGGVAMSDAVTAAARQDYPNDTPSVAISKWMQANGVTIDNEWNAFSSNQSSLMKGGKALTIADLISGNVPSAPTLAAPASIAPDASSAAPAAVPAAGPTAAPSPSAPVAPASPATPAPAANVGQSFPGSGTFPAMYKFPNAATTAAPAAAPAAEAAPGRTASGGVVIDGTPFEPSRSLAGERNHGDQYTGINAKTNQLETRYWDANKNTWSKNPVFVGNGDAPDVARIKGEDAFLGLIPYDAAAMNTAPGRLIEQGRAAGIIDESALAAAVAADAKVSKGSYRDGGYVRGYLQSLAPQFNAMARTNAMKDPRIAKFAAGDFTGDAGLPDEAMALAEQIGINRAQFGIPEAGIGESLPGGLGAVFAPAGYGAAQEAMPRGLQAFFQAVRDGRVDPRRLTVRPPSAQPVAAR